MLEYQERQLYLLRKLHRLQNELRQMLRVAQYQMEVLVQGLKVVV
jgi:hypothetical protein